MIFFNLRIFKDPPEMPAIPCIQGDKFYSFKACICHRISHCSSLYTHKRGSLELSSLGAILGAFFLCRPLFELLIYPLITQGIKADLGAGRHEISRSTFI